MLNEDGVDPSTFNKRQKEIYATWKKVGKLFDLHSVLAQEAENDPTTSDAKAQEAELVIAIIHGRDHAVKRACLVCQQHFLTDYISNRYCSNECRRVALESVGVQWNPDKPAWERWGGHPPATIAPSTLEAIQKHVKALLQLKVDEVV